MRDAGDRMAFRTLVDDYRYATSLVGYQNRQLERDGFEVKTMRQEKRMVLPKFELALIDCDDSAVWPPLDDQAAIRNRKCGPCDCFQRFLGFLTFVQRSDQLSPATNDMVNAFKRFLRHKFLNDNGIHC